MKIITRQSLANEASARWKEQYQDYTYYPGMKEKGQALEALAQPIRPDDVDRIIGNTSWTTPSACNVCSKHNGPVIEVGEEPDYESHTAYVCFDCARKIAQLADEFKTQP